MLIRDSDGLVLFNAAGMIGNGGTYKNYWGNYWTCPRCHRSWGNHFVGCGGCGGDSKEVAPSPVGADGWLDQQKLKEIIESSDAVVNGFGAVYNAINAIVDEQEKIVNEVTEKIKLATKGSIPKPTAEEKLEEGSNAEGYAARRVGQRDATFAAEGTFITKPTAEEILESIRKIIYGCEWLYEHDSEGADTGNVQITIDCEEWDNLKSLLREDGPGKVWRV